MQVLYISQYYPPETCAPASRVDCFTREWVRAGADVRVLTGFPNHPEGILHAEYRKAWRRGFMREEREGVKVYRTWLYPSANRKLWGRGANFTSFALSAALAGLCVAPRHGVVIATSPQILVGVSGWAVGTLRFLPWVFEVRDLWPESLVGVGQAAADSLLYRSVGQVANFLYRHATHIVVDGEWKRRHLIHQGVEESRISVIRNGIEEDFCLPPNSADARMARLQLRQELGLGDEFVLLYAGTLGMAHGLETVLRAAERLRGREDIVFLLMGAGAERGQLSELVAGLRLANVRLLEKQPREKIPALSRSRGCLLGPVTEQGSVQKRHSLQNVRGDGSREAGNSGRRGRSEGDSSCQPSRIGSAAGRLRGHGGGNSQAAERSVALPGPGPERKTGGAGKIPAADAGGPVPKPAKRVVYSPEAPGRHGARDSGGVIAPSNSEQP